MFSGFYQRRNIKVSERNNLSECPHKYLMCSIFPCESSGVHVCVCVCVQSVITSLLQKKTPTEEAREGEQSEGMKERAAWRGKKSQTAREKKTHDYDNLQS